MTTGLQLKINLGLENFTYVKIARIITSPIKILVVYYNSFRTSMPITNTMVRQSPKVMSVFRGSSIMGNDNSYPAQTPLADISEYSGNISSALIIAVDLAGRHRINPDMFARDFKESVEKNSLYKNGSFSYLALKGLQELTVYDLAKNQGMSDFTKTFRKERSGIMGKETKSSKLVDVDINKEEDYVMFYWLSESTEKYPDNYVHKETDPDTLKLKNDPSKTYTIMLKIKDFFQWLDTFNIKDEITKKDLKEILQVADIEVWSTDPSYQYQSLNYNMSQLDSSIYPTSIAPKQWNKPELHGDGNAFLSKHMQGIFNSIDFYLNIMAQMLLSRLRKRNLI